MLTIFENSIRKIHEKLGMSDIYNISIFAKNPCTDLTDYEKETAENIIKNKHVDLERLSKNYITLTYSKDGRKSYNAYTKRITDCLTKEDWELLKRYYASPYKEEK